VLKVTQILPTLYMMKYLACFLITLLCSAHSLAQLEDARLIRSVWTMQAQSCNGVPGNSMERHQAQESIRASRLVALEDLGFTFSVPQFPEVEETVLKLYLGDASRGVVDNYILISDQDLEAPFAAVVITELPASMQTRKQAFAAVQTLQTQLSEQSGTIVNLETINGPHGASLEMIVKDRVGSFCFPTSDFVLLPEGSGLASTGISRFSFTQGKLVEFSVVVSNPPGMNDQEARAHARTIMDGFWSRLREI
jgi:hypothetical protein